MASVDGASLGSMFRDGLNIYNKLSKIEEPSNSPAVQDLVNKAIAILEETTRLVSYADIFGKNEGVEELPTSHLQYLLLPALLGSLTLKLTAPRERSDVVRVAEIYLRDFLSRCNNYGLCRWKMKEASEDETGSDSPEQFDVDKIIAMSTARENKIRRFAEQKELKSKLEDLQETAENEHADEDLKRDYFMTMIKLFINESLEELGSIEMEKPILEHLSKLKREGGSDREVVPTKSRPLKPIIITKDEVQKAVFGAGYPGLPTMTVQEFYDKRVKDGVFPDPSKKSANAGLSMQQAALAGSSLNDEEKEAEQRENIEESDDPEYIARLRQLDEHKDEHRRGWGNRMNRS